MVKCLILYHQTITILTRCFILRAIFTDEEFEIHVRDQHTVILFLWNVPREVIWQVALTLETADIATSYGEGKVMQEAEDQAMDGFRKRTALTTEQKPANQFEIRETMATYMINLPV